MAPTIAWTDVTIGKRVLVMFVFVGGVILQTAFSIFVATGALVNPEQLWPTLVASITLFACLVQLLLRGHLTLRAIVTSSVIATLIFAVAYALLSQLASGGSHDLAGYALTRIFYFFLATGDIAVAFFLCMIVGAVVRFLHLNPERKTLRYR